MDARDDSEELNSICSPTASQVSRLSIPSLPLGTGEDGAHLQGPRSGTFTIRSIWYCRMAIQTVSRADSGAITSRISPHRLLGVSWSSEAHSSGSHGISTGFHSALKWPRISKPERVAGYKDVACDAQVELRSINSSRESVFAGWCRSTSRATSAFCVTENSVCVQAFDVPDVARLSVVQSLFSCYTSRFVKMSSPPMLSLTSRVRLYTACNADCNGH